MHFTLIAGHFSGELDTFLASSPYLLRVAVCFNNPEFHPEFHSEFPIIFSQRDFVKVVPIL